MYSMCRVRLLKLGVVAIVLSDPELLWFSHPDGSIHPLTWPIHSSPTGPTAQQLNHCNRSVLATLDDSLYTLFCPAVPPTDPWREPSLQTSVRWSRCRNASCCKSPNTLSNLSFKVPLMSRNIQAAKIMCHVFFFPHTFHPPSETETARFSEAIKTLSAKTNPLADIGEHLRKRMRREEEQGQSWRMARSQWYIVLRRVWTWSLGRGGRGSGILSARNETLLTRLSPGPRWLAWSVWENHFAALCFSPLFYCLYYLLVHLL